MAVALAIGPSLARADYLLSSGDVLDVTVFRVPELSREVTVDVDGRIAFPPLGRVDVRGSNLDEVSGRIREMLAAQEILSDAQVTTALKVARPIFIGGDVARPGGYPYQAGLSVRQAIALAGGVGVGRDRAFGEAAILRGALETGAIDLFRQQARLARLEAALAGRDTLEIGPDAAAVPVPAAQRDEILALERQRLRADLEEVREEKAHLERDSALVQSRIETLVTQQAVQQRLMEQQDAEIARIRGIQDRGLASQSRVMEERRAFDGMQERASANASEISAVREAYESATYALARFDARRRAGLESEKQEALLAIASLTAGLRSTEAQLAQLGASNLGRVDITLYRTEDGREVARVGTLDALLAPGETVEVTFELDAPGTAPLAAPVAGPDAPKP